MVRQRPTLDIQTTPRGNIATWQDTRHRNSQNRKRRCREAATTRQRHVRDMLEAIQQSIASHHTTSITHNSII